MQFNFVSMDKSFAIVDLSEHGSPIIKIIIYLFFSINASNIFFPIILLFNKIIIYFRYHI